MTRIVLDAVGGDHAPQETVAGVVAALQQGYVDAGQIVLTGPEALVRQQLVTAGLGADAIEIVDAPDVLTGDDSPTDAMRKKAKNSIAVVATRPPTTTSLAEVIRADVKAKKNKRGAS